MVKSFENLQTFAPNQKSNFRCFTLVVMQTKTIASLMNQNGQ
ncbi:hypothetical protein Acj61p033 [Acinetobacter phage Acj61]|uniref:Uncharacterized protein n=1 Tax=Acinetobacter phage Acj61 TaxID=760732 RepID=E5E414_9CAUD|nr:hypothetical protein Acj61p033 [Acinetobacter phage Acj61]ADG35998.1 hypothetical protein Acj61p033 [Acinetobacter phage Acj61]